MTASCARFDNRRQMGTTHFESLRSVDMKRLSLVLPESEAADVAVNCRRPLCNHFLDDVTMHVGQAVVAAAVAVGSTFRD